MAGSRTMLSQPKLGALTHCSLGDRMPWHVALTLVLCARQAFCLPSVLAAAAVGVHSGA